MNAPKSAIPLADFPVAPEALPRETLSSGPYHLAFARTLGQLRAVQRLRFEVFNLEMGEGLQESFASGLDEDGLDRAMHHLVITDTRTHEVVGTYRMMTAAMASACGGFYTAREFDLSAFPAPVTDAAAEVGRACIAKEHRSRRVLHLLWQGLARYLLATDKHYLFGCCSLTTQDMAVARQVHVKLVEEGHLHEHLRAWPLPGFECSPPEDTPPLAESFPVPPLFASYLNLGANICGPPAIDRAFGTVDFLVVLDVRDLEAHVYRNFFR